MQVDVIASINELHTQELLGKTVMVIDVLRATSSIVTAFAHGCEAIIPVETVSQARQWNEKQEYLLGGERFCKKISGFDFGNSPLEFTQADLTGKKLVMTTTNGTRALQKTHKGSRVLTASFLNGKAAVKYGMDSHRDWVLVCAGTRDQFSLEDGLCAGYLLDMLAAVQPDAQMNDMGQAMLSAYRHTESNLVHTLLNCENGRKMIKNGMKEDVHFCAQMNAYAIVPLLQEHMLIPVHA
ncbi:2-phosphosulfolactate phosphatase [Marinicrinis sediminis]|uniref:Probable 2-phosphosulfolactate phosphatase n=1 Tax=Marinicrinis sediminis TaxID=1652465 RepID=A0ABW5RDF2_9BACL